MKSLLSVGCLMLLALCAGCRSQNSEKDLQPEIMETLGRMDAKIVELDGQLATEEFQRLGLAVPIGTAGDKLSLVVPKKNSEGKSYELHELVQALHDADDKVAAVHAPKEKPKPAPATRQDLQALLKAQAELAKKVDAMALLQQQKCKKLEGTTASHSGPSSTHTCTSCHERKK